MTKFVKELPSEGAAAVLAARLKAWRFAATAQGNRVFLTPDRSDLNPVFKGRLALIGFVPCK